MDIVFPYLFFAFFGFVTAMLLMLFLCKNHMTGAFEEGQIKALKRAIECVKERGDIALLVAPPGELTAAMVRAQTAHQLEMDLRRLLAEV